jgi:hypothetical protein
MLLPWPSLPPTWSSSPPKFTLAQRREIEKIPKSKPAEHNLPFSTWSLAKLAGFLVAEGVVDDISHEGHKEQASMIRRYIIWRNNHVYDERLRRIVAKANVA